MGLTGRTKAAVLWGATGALSFLVLAGAYLLLSPAHVALTNLLVVGLVVFLLATVLSYLAEPHLTSLQE